jgi:hypothetical protein
MGPMMTGTAAPVMAWWMVAVPLTLLALAVLAGASLLWAARRGIGWRQVLTVRPAPRAIAIAPDTLRLSDADRSRAAAALQSQVGTGRLTLDEVDGRLAAVYAARTKGDLRQVFADLPDPELPAGGR